ncbi:MAG: hypothetical protein A2252_09015 [Elusimicrobia bacterium RIFOXYA2_FULL_39_19]|nr:MAG: hypothetical protein A2252_09015 [Elusimicrobia bacterium RIFOXYA2_FULL_39_19]
MENQELCCIILANPESLDRKVLAPLFREYAKFNNTISEVSARHCAGFLLEKGAKEEVLALGKLCAQQQVKILVLPVSSIPQLPKADKCININCHPGALEFTLSIGNAKIPYTIPWNKVEVVSAATIEEEKTSTVIKKEGPSNFQRMASGVATVITMIPISAGKEKKVEKKVHEIVISNYVELLFSLPPYRARIPQDNFDYSYLQKRREYSSQLNFIKMIEDINLYASTALKSRGFISSVNKEQDAQNRYEDYRFLEKELRWLIMLRNAGINPA